MKNKTADDYYTRGITSSGNEGEEEDFKVEGEYDDVEYDLDKVNSSMRSAIFGNNILTAANRSLHSIDDDGLVLMSDKYLIDKMEWLRSLDPQNPEIDNPLDFLQKSESTNSLSSDSAYSSLESQLMLEKLSNNPLVRERLEWQTMLSSVLKGDIAVSYTHLDVYKRQV